MPPKAVNYNSSRNNGLIAPNTMFSEKRIKKSRNNSWNFANK